MSLSNGRSTDDDRAKQPGDISFEKTRRRCSGAFFFLNLLWNELTVEKLIQTLIYQYRTNDVN